MSNNDFNHLLDILEEEGAVCDCTLNESQHGTFVGVHLTKDSKSKLFDWMRRQGIENPVSPEDFHVTLAFSKDRAFEYAPDLYDPPIEIDPSTYQIEHFGENNDVLVLRFDSPELEKRHQELRDKYNLPWDFDEYAPHVTLSYESLSEVKELPDFPLELRREYTQPFDTSDIKDEDSLEEVDSKHLKNWKKTTKKARKSKNRDTSREPAGLYQLGEVTGRYRTTDAMRQNAKGNKCQVMVEMSPMDFLRLTTSDEESIKNILSKAQPLFRYAQWAKMADKEEYRQFRQERDPDNPQYGTIVHPFLNISFSDDGSEARVTGHEGRHRAAAVINAGGDSFPVALCLKPGKDMLPDVKFGPEYKMDSSFLPEYIKGQFRPIRLPVKHWKIIDDGMLKHVG